MNPFCTLCEREIGVDRGHPWLKFKEKPICSNCYEDLIPHIYQMAGRGDGGVIHLHFKFCLTSSHNRKHRKTLSNYKKILQQLLHKYKFQCVECGCMDESRLTVDHIVPVSKGGSDDMENLQILCKSCNSRKRDKYEESMVPSLR